MKALEIERLVEKYYSEKINQFGPVPRGVDWKNDESQTMRFDQLTRCIDRNQSTYSVLDFGCGYGALLSYLLTENSHINYTGFDISVEMIKSALATHPKTPAAWLTESARLAHYDYVIASGIFNVKGPTSEQDWEKYVSEKLAHFHSLSTRGFAFNMLTHFADPEKKKDSLYYADPTRFFNFCQSNFSKHIALHHDYPLYEFTIIVRKDIL